MNSILSSCMYHLGWGGCSNGLSSTTCGAGTCEGCKTLGTSMLSNAMERSEKSDGAGLVLPTEPNGLDDIGGTGTAEGAE
jgi:hypothetical protein